MSLAPADHADYVTERLVEFVNSTVEKANGLMDINTTTSPGTPTTLNVPQLVAEFMMIRSTAASETCQRRCGPMRLGEDELHAFGVDYSVTTRVTRVKGDEQEFQVLMGTYEHARQVVKDMENVFMKTHADNILDRLLEAQISLQDVRVRLDGFSGYRVETLQELQHVLQYGIYWAPSPFP